MLLLSAADSRCTRWFLQGLKSLLERLEKTVPLMAAQRRKSILPAAVRRSSSMKRSSVVGEPRRASNMQPAAPAAVSRPETSGSIQAENSRPSMTGRAPFWAAALAPTIAVGSQDSILTKLFTHVCLEDGTGHMLDMSGMQVSMARKEPWAGSLWWHQRCLDGSRASCRKMAGRGQPSDWSHLPRKMEGCRRCPDCLPTNLSECVPWAQHSEV